MALAVVKDVIQTSSSCVPLLKEVGTIVCNIANGLLDDITKLKKQGCDKLHDVKEAVRDVKELIHKAYTFIDNVDDIFQYWSKMDSNKLKDGDTSLVNAFIDDFRKLLSKCEQLYQELEEAAKETRKSSSRAATECDKLAAEAKTKKTTAQVVGGTASAGLIAMTAAGVTGSIVAGIFTFGIGTAVGLAVTGAAVAGTATAGAIATGTTIITVVIAKNYSDAAKTFRGIGYRLNDLERATNGFIDGLHTLKRGVDNFERALEILMRQKNKELIIICIERLQQKGTELHQSLYSCRNDVKNTKKKMDDI